MKANVGAWLRAANPFQAARSLAEAQRAARMGAVVLVIQALHTAIHAARLALDPGQLARTMEPYMAVEGLDGAGLETGLAWVRSFTPFILGASLLGVVLWLILARVQWRRMTRTIPLILLALAAFRLATLVEAGGVSGRVRLEMGLMGSVGLLVFVLCALLILSACRGAFVLHKLKRTV